MIRRQEAIDYYGGGFPSGHEQEDDMALPDVTVRDGIPGEYQRSEFQNATLQATEDRTVDFSIALYIGLTGDEGNVTTRLDRMGHDIVALLETEYGVVASFKAQVGPSEDREERTT